MCVLSIKVPIRKKSANLFNDPRTYAYTRINTYKYTVNHKIICKPMNIEFLTHFLESNTHTMQDYLYVIKYKERNIKLSFERDRLNLLNMRRKLNKRWKRQLFVQYEKLKNSTISTILFVNSMAFHLNNLLQSFCKVFDEIWTSLFWDFLTFFNGYTF